MTDLQPTVSLGELFGSGQIRLSQIAMYNWGTFSGLHLASIHPESTLITGVTGAGKTTAADAFITLINGPKSANYNAAAAKESGADRSLVSYVRGSYGSVADDDGEGGARPVYKRPGATASLIQARFTQDDGRHFSIGMMCWINGGGNAAKDVRRLFFTARLHLEASDILEASGNRGAAALKRYLEDNPQATAFEKFADYQVSVRHLLCLENENAPALLARALGLKEIKDLTSLLRDLVLEPSQVPDAARKAIAAFETLDQTHDKLVEAREQEHHLEKLPGWQSGRKKAREQEQAFLLALAALDVHVAEQAVALHDELILAEESALHQLQTEAARIEEDKATEQERLEGLQKDFHAQGGERIERIRQDLEQAVKDLRRIIQGHDRYRQDVTRAGLSEARSAGELERQIAAAEADRIRLKEEQGRLEEQKGQQNLERLQSERRITDLIEQIRAIEARKDSNVAPEYQQVRDGLCQHLKLERDKIPFVAELLDVKQGEAGWRGAIERALGFEKLQLLVPANNYDAARRYLNSRHLGLRVAVQRVDSEPQGAPEFMHDGFLCKLEWKRHSYRQFLKRHLARRDYHCVVSADAMADTEFCLTKEGLIQRRRGQLEKDDSFRVTDKRRWALGFNNQVLLTERKNELADRTREHEAARSKVEQYSGQLSACAEKLNALGLLDRYQWLEIDVAAAERRRNALRKEHDELRANSETLRQLEDRISTCKNGIEILGKKAEKKILAQGKSEERLSRHRDAREKDIETAAQGVEDAPRALLDDLFEPLAAADMANRINLRVHRGKVLEIHIEREKRTINSCNNNTGKCLATFSQRWGEIALDWGTDMEDSVAEYLAFHDKLIEEGLPELEDEFQDLLNQQSSQSLTGLVNMMQAEHQEIEERIDTINRVLHKTTFHEATYLSLGCKKLTDVSVHAVRQQVRKVREATGRDDNEARYGAIKAVIELLRKHIELTTIEARRTLDPRHQLKFFAEEKARDTDERRDYLDSSAGKSGGEKESFAGIILAASLAYVLSPDGSDKPVYSSVFLDEAFSNTSEAVARRVLEVFKQLHLHVNLITPMKNLNIAQDAAATLVIALKDEKTHDSHFSDLSWERAEELYLAEIAGKKLEEIKPVAITG